MIVLQPRIRGVGGAHRVLDRNRMPEGVLA